MTLSNLKLGVAYTVLMAAALALIGTLFGVFGWFLFVAASIIGWGEVVGITVAVLVALALVIWATTVVDAAEETADDEGDNA